MTTSIDAILKRNQLSITDSRKRILELFVQNSGALEHADIEKKTGEKFDRVTVYRTLQSFLEKGIIHTIPTSGNSVRYALCKEECRDGHHHDNKPLIIFYAGILLLFAKQIWHSQQLWLLPMAVVFVIAAHLLNLRCCRVQRKVHTGDCNH